MQPYEYINKYDDIYTFTPLDENTILMVGGFKHMRVERSETDNKINMIDPIGGPYITVGMSSEAFYPTIKEKVVVGIIADDSGYKLIIESYEQSR